MQHLAGDFRLWPEADPADSNEGRAAYLLVLLRLFSTQQNKLASLM